MRWTGQCYRCHQEREIESRSDHAMQALCDECAAKPHQKPRATPDTEREHGRSRAKGPRRVIIAAPGQAARYVPVHWLWRQYVPLGKITLLAGLAGQGKSQLTCLLAAWTTRGDLDAPAGHVVVASAEDDMADTIWPRLGASGADLHRTTILDMREQWPDGTTRPSVIALPDDAAAIEDFIRTVPGPRLLVLDPVQAFLSGGVDSNRGAEVRRALAPLKTMAETFGMAIVLVTHLNKTRDAEPLARITDSGAYTALARGVLLMAPDPEDEEGDRGSSKVMALAKSNLAATGEHSLRFRIAPTKTTDDHGTTVEVGVVELLGRSKLSAHDLLIPADQRPALDEARIFLRAELAGGWRKATEIQKAAKGLHSESTLRRARETECQRPRQHDRAWWWGLKGVPWPTNGVSDAPLTRVNPTGEHLGHLRGSDAQISPQMFQMPSGEGHAREGSTDHLRRRDEMLGERWDDDE